VSSHYRLLYLRFLSGMRLERRVLFWGEVGKTKIVLADERGYSWSQTNDELFERYAISL
jgi:hypothetical protein